jgi:DNA recombination protein RmuC
MKFEYFIYYCTFTYSNNTTMTTIYILVALAVGFLVGWLFAGRKVSSKEVELAKAASDRDAAIKLSSAEQAKSEQLSIQLMDSQRAQAASEERLKAMQEKLDSQQKEMDQLHERFKLEFQNIAHEILQQNSKSFEEQSNRNLSELLKPLGMDLENFRKQVNEAYSTESSERASLKGEIKKLTELNSRISEEANNLTLALKGDSKMQGDWGEMILKDILDRSGLKEGEQYFYQDTLKDEAGKALTTDEGHRMRRDVVVKYPGNRHIIIDSKVSLSAYMDYQSAETPEVKRDALHRHVASLRKHIDELSAVDYAKYDKESPDFVMMFIPNEPAFTLALNENPQLWMEAYDKKVVLMTPTNLISALRLALDLWQRKEQEDHITEIVNRGTALYDKVVNFCTNFDNLGKSVENLSKAYDTAHNQLTGNGGVTRQIEMLRQTSIQSKKRLPPSMLPLEESQP